MKNNVNLNGKFYVQIMDRIPQFTGGLTVKQIKTYKYKDLVGGVFEMSNLTKNLVKVDIPNFVQQFNNVKSSYPSVAYIQPKQQINVLVVQKLTEK